MKYWIFFDETAFFEAFPFLVNATIKKCFLNPLPPFSKLFSEIRSKDSRIFKKRRSFAKDKALSTENDKL